MSKKLLQIDFKVDGPWGKEMAKTYASLAKQISSTSGLLWKIWTENEATKEQGGIYLFEDEASLKAYLEEHAARLESFGITKITAKTFEVNEELTRITFGSYLK